MLPAFFAQREQSLATLQHFQFDLKAPDPKHEAIIH